MDQRDAAAGHFHDFPKTAGDFDETSADRLAGDDSRRRDNVLRHVVRAIRDEPQPERALTAIVAALGLALDAAGGASLRHGADVADHLGIVLAQVEARERIDHLSRTDHLTSLANRAAFFDEFTRRLSHLGRNRPAAALLYVDVANLQRVNAVRGPDAGDAALSALSGLLREHTRSGDLIARFGGGGFVVWIERIEPAGARARAAALAAAVARLAPFAGAAEPAFGVSIGVAPFDAARNETVMQLVLRAAADAARTKEQGGEPWPASLPA